MSNATGDCCIALVKLTFVMLARSPWSMHQISKSSTHCGHPVRPYAGSAQCKLLLASYERLTDAVKQTAALHVTRLTTVWSSLFSSF